MVGENSDAEIQAAAAGIYTGSGTFVTNNNVSELLQAHRAGGVVTGSCFG